MSFRADIENIIIELPKKYKLSEKEAIEIYCNIIEALEWDSVADYKNREKILLKELFKK